jgi:hypothetical protein
MLRGEERPLEGVVHVASELSIVLKSGGSVTRAELSSFFKVTLPH